MIPGAAGVVPGAAGGMPAAAGGVPGAAGGRPAAAGVVLAAGAGTRFGGPKALVRLDGERLVDRAVSTLRAGGCGDVVVVQGAATLENVDATVLHNPGWTGGMGSSLRVALSHLRSLDAAVAVVLLVDTPWVGAGAVARLLEVAAATGCAAAQASYGGVPGHPVLLTRRTWDEVAAGAVGDRGAREWLRGHHDLVREVPCDGTGDPRDVDRPADLGQEPRA